MPEPSQRQLSQKHPHAFAIAPIDRCYMLVGLIKASWEGISGGAAMERAIADYFDELRAASQ